MSRRCKPGQRAKIIGDGWNNGKIVVVLRHYFGGPIEDGHNWPNAVFQPWVVMSLGSPLRAEYLETSTEAPPLRYAVCEDRDLEPLDDDEDGLARHSGKDVPVETALASGPR